MILPPPWTDGWAGSNIKKGKLFKKSFFTASTHDYYDNNNSWL